MHAKARQILTNIEREEEEEEEGSPQVPQSLSISFLGDIPARETDCGVAALRPSLITFFPILKKALLSGVLVSPTTATTLPTWIREEKRREEKSRRHVQYTLSPSFWRITCLLIVIYRCHRSRIQPSDRWNELSATAATAAVCLSLSLSSLLFLVSCVSYFTRVWRRRRRRRRRDHLVF